MAPSRSKERGRRIGDGLRVVEIGSSVSLAVAGMVLADNGAEVIAVEPPGGSPLRSQPAFRMWARGKNSLVADLRQAADRNRVLELAGDADAVLVGLKPAAVDRFALRYEDVTRGGDRPVYCALSGFGSRGPYRDVPAYDGLIAAKAGRTFEFGALFGGERPAHAAAPVATHAAAMLVLQAVFAALLERERTGRGQRLETSLVQALGIYDLVHWMPGAPMELRLEDIPFVPYTVGRTADGIWVQFAQNGPKLFEAFIRALDLKGDSDGDVLLTPQLAKAPELRALRARLLERLAQKTWAEWQEVFASEHDVSAEPFLLPGEALEHPQLVHAGDSRELDDPDVGRTRQLGPLIDLSDQPGYPSGPAPAPNSVGTGGWTGARLAVSGSERAPARGGLLEGVTVLELATWIATPFSATLLADLGARVIKIEPLTGDPMRTAGPVGYKMVQGKRSIALDLKRPEGREIVHQLVARADALAHNYRPGVPERLGIDYATLHEVNPRLVYLYGASYGSTGPMSWKAAFHVTAGAICGGARAQAGAAMPPGPGVELSADEAARAARYLEQCNESNPDFNAAATAAAALLMGLYARERTGVGQALETRMMLSNAYVMSKDFIDYAGRAARELPDAEVLGLGPLYRLYPTAEGWVFIAAPAQRDFERLCQGLGRSSLLRDPRFAQAEARIAHAEELARELEAALRERGADDWEAELTARGVGCMRADQGPHARFMYGAPWARELGYVVDAEGSAYGSYRRFGRAISLDRETGPLGGAYRAGEHTRDILRELGYPGEAIDALLRGGVVAEPSE